MSGGGGGGVGLPILPTLNRAQVNGQLNDINFMAIQTSRCVSLVRFLY